MAQGVEMVVPPVGLGGIEEGDPLPLPNQQVSHCCRNCCEFCCFCCTDSSIARWVRLRNWVVGIWVGIPQFCTDCVQGIWQNCLTPCWAGTRQCGVDMWQHCLTPCVGAIRGCIGGTWKCFVRCLRACGRFVWRSILLPYWRRVGWLSVCLLIMFGYIFITGAAFFGVQQGFLNRHHSPPSSPASPPAVQPFSGGSQYIDGIYWSTTTLTTVGFGDIVPKTDGAMLLTSLMIIVGICGMTMVSYTFNEYWSKVEDSVFDFFGWCPRRRRRMLLRRAFSTLYSVVFLGVGWGLLWKFQNLGPAKAFYTAVVAESTVGYGDLTFTDETARVLATFWLLGATLSCGRMLALQSDHRLKRRERRLLCLPLTVAEQDHVNNQNANERLHAYYEIKLSKLEIDQDDRDFMRNQFDGLPLNIQQ